MNYVQEIKYSTKSLPRLLILTKEESLIRVEVKQNVIIYDPSKLSLVVFERQAIQRQHQ